MWKSIVVEDQSDRRSVLNSLQVGRAIAALAVACCHSEQFVRQFTTIPDPVSSLFMKGYLGVDFFFVLSGFIIHYSSAGRASLNGWAKSFALSRASRIFVPYLPIGIVVGLVYAARPALATHDWNWFSTVTLLPSGAQPALSVAWTLQHEITFYFIMLILLRTDQVLVGCILWMFAIIIFQIFVGTDTPGLSLIDIEFMMGVFISHCYLSGRYPHRILIVLSAALCLSGALMPWTEARLAFAAGLALLLLPLLRLEQTGKLRFPALLLFFGNASYAIYVVHIPFLRLASRLLSELGPFALLGFLIGIALAAGAAYHLAWERPMLALLRGRSRQAASTSS